MPTARNPLPPHTHICVHAPDPLFPCSAHSTAVKAGGSRAGQWRGVEVAIKTVLLSSNSADQVTSSVAREAAIATNLGHSNIVATYNHDVRVISPSASQELDVCKIYLIQVSPSDPPHTHATIQCRCTPPLLARMHASSGRPDKQRFVRLPWGCVVSRGDRIVVV